MKRIMSDKEKAIRAKYPDITDEEWEEMREYMKKMSFMEMIALVLSKPDGAEALRKVRDDLTSARDAAHKAGLN